MQKDDLNGHVFQYKNWCSLKSMTVRGPFHRKDLKWEKIWGYGVNFKKTEVLYVERNERAEAATGTYSEQAILVSIFILCRWLRIIGTSDQSGYRAAILMKNSLWLLPFYMVVAIYFYYEKVRRTMHTAILSNLFKIATRKSVVSN